MTSDRPYRKGTSFSKATEEIMECAGKQFDPEIVKRFLSLPKDTWHGLREVIAEQPKTKSINFSHMQVASGK